MMVVYRFPRVARVRLTLGFEILPLWGTACFLNRAAFARMQGVTRWLQRRAC